MKRLEQEAREAAKQRPGLCQPWLCVEVVKAEKHKLAAWTDNLLLLSHFAAVHCCVKPNQQDEEDSKYAYNSDDDTDYGMANSMDV